MEFRNFNPEDVFGPDDVEQAKAYIGKRGYYAVHLEQLDDYIENKRHIDTLYTINKSRNIYRFMVGCSYDYCGNYTYFLPLEKVKKTDPTEKKLKWRPCKDIEELEDLLNCDVLAFVGRVLELKDKSTGATIIVGITGTKELPIDSGSIYSIILGNGQVYSFADLFDKFEINVNDKWQPFGVKAKNE